MELTTIELAKKLIEKADKIEADFKCAFTEGDNGYFMKITIVDNLYSKGELLDNTTK